MSDALRMKVFLGGVWTVSWGRPFESLTVRGGKRTLSLVCAVSQLVCWCFEPSQPQRITSGLKTNFSLSPSYSLNKL